MNIRSVTAFVDVSDPLDDRTIADAASLQKRIRESLSGAGLATQTLRLATQPVAQIVPSPQTGQLAQFASAIEQAAHAQGIDYVSLGLVRLGDDLSYLAAVPEMLAHAPGVFTSVEIARLDTGIDFARLRAAAGVVQAMSTLTSDGFGNLRLAALANVRPWSPFFPAAYHGGGPMRVALATESADLAVSAVSGAASLAEARRELILQIESHARKMEDAARPVVEAAGAIFQGIDFSLAPYPEDARSIGLALEKLGVVVGNSGTLMAAAFLTEALERAKFTKTGFCGLMLPVLEDSVLASRAEEGRLHVTDLLAWSAVCGTGLDTIPLPGDMTESELAAILADVAALALRLDKQLTARLMPLPGKQAGDPTEFSFEFFAPSRVLEITRGGLTGLLAGSEVLEMLPRHSTR